SQIGFLTGPILLSSVLALPCLFLGTWLGYRANRRLPRRWFELAMIGVAVAGSLKLLAD
ncbi:MAG: sulfite exporter TauE/SafE family protein, partial [Candidatus Rokubacteria bacterium]|nr:sulfite exporter TauE/SafE family protein [Candidatus Rokubacteria bacterium]